MRIFKKEGNDLLSHLAAVPSALIGLTSLFGMGRGEPYRYNHLKSFQLTIISFHLNCLLIIDQCLLSTVYV